MDPEAVIHRTDYFNHTYIPDVVMRWPDEQQRDVFLRFLSPDSTKSDFERLGRGGPVFFDLSPATQSADSSDEAATVPESSWKSAPRVLVTDTEATQIIRPSESKNPVERVFTSNLLRGGRGQLTAHSAEAGMVSIRAGFEGAATLNSDLIRSTVETARLMLQDEYERRIEKLLQLLWWAGGGEPDEFPLSFLDDTELNPSDTREFLREVFTNEHPIDDADFWERLADRITYDMLVDVGEIQASDNLNRLMSPLSRKLVLSHAAVNRDDRLPLYGDLAWEISDSFLQLRGFGWACRLTPHGNRFSQRRNEGRAVALRVAEARSSAYLVTEAEIEESARRVHFTRIEDTEMTASSTLKTLMEGFDADSHIRSLVVEVQHRRITADYDRMLLASEPDSSVHLMATMATDLLLSLSEEERGQVRSFLTKSQTRDG